MPAGREKDLGRMHSNLAAIFEEERETALAVLSRHFAVREEFYHGFQSHDLHVERSGKLKSFFDRSMNHGFAADVGEVDAAFLRAVLCFEYHYNRMQVL